jgi:hypothetical protein
LIHQKLQALELQALQLQAQQLQALQLQAQSLVLHLVHVQVVRAQETTHLLLRRGHRALETIHFHPADQARDQAVAA